MWGSDRLRAGHQEVGKCSTRGESWGMYVTFASAKIANKAEPTMALKPRGDVTRNPKQGYQWPQKRTCVRQKTLKKKKKKKKIQCIDIFLPYPQEPTRSSLFQERENKNDHHNIQSG